MLETERMRRSNSAFYLILFLTVFSAGLMNSSSFFILIGLTRLNLIVSICFYLLLGFLSFYLLINKMLIRKPIFSGTLPYWSILLFAVLFKFFILFIQNPFSLFPGGEYFSEFVHFISILSIMILLINTIETFNGIKVTIWGLGLGASFAAIIPFLFPEMIGSRAGVFQGHYFSGGFWNSAVISYISVGWLLVSLSSVEKSRIRRFFLISLFLIMAFGGLAGLSRSTLLSLIVSISVYLLFAKKVKKVIKVILSGLIIVLLIINLFSDLVLNFSQRLDGGIEIQNETRTEIWLDYFEDLPSYFLFGALDGDYTKYSSFSMGPHSTILNWLVQFGILGVLGFVALLIGFIKSIKRIKKHFYNETSAALYAWLAAYLSVALINQTGFTQLTVFAAFGIILAWGNVSKKLVN